MRALVYMVAQTIGGFLGAVVLLLLCPTIPGVTSIGAGYTAIQVTLEIEKLNKRDVTIHNTYPIRR